VMLENWDNSSGEVGPFRGRSAAGNPDLVSRKNGEARGGKGQVESCPLFSGIVTNEQAGISAGARIREFTRGEMLYIAGDTVQQVLLLTAGSVKVTQLGMGGAEVIIRLVTPGDVLGAVGLFSTGRHCTTAQAFRLCRALVWDALAFRAMVERFPIVHQNLVRIIGEDLLELEERFREVATERVAPRVARQLVRLQEQIGQPVEGAVEICLSREELAQMTGTTLFTVSRLLSTWESCGIVRPRREAVAICDLRSLRAIAEEKRPRALAAIANPGDTAAGLDIE
jgi:CRP-like cAMP-binding protein